jgi:glycosyltransferase involved in cell wall biosynthesis
MPLRPCVLFYVTRFTATGGGPNALTELARQLVARGYQVEIFTRPPYDPEHPYARAVRAAGIPVTVWPWREVGRAAQTFALVLATLGAAPYALLRGKPLSFAWTAARSVGLARLAALELWQMRRDLDRSAARARREGRAVVLHIWAPALVTPRLLDWAHAAGTPGVFHEMGEADPQYVAHWNLDTTVEAVNHADAVVCCSDSVARSLAEAYRFTGEIIRIPFMVHEPVPIEGAGPRPLTFGAIGRLVPHKRHADLLQALRLLRDEGHDVRLLIAGDGPCLPNLRALAESLGLLEAVTFTGEFESLPQVMAAFDVFVLASASESQCMPITESMAYGKAVVASRFGGIPDFVEEGVTGLLVPVGEVAELAAAMRRLIVHPELRRAMGAQGRERYLERYSAAAVLSQWERVYERLLDDTSPLRSPARHARTAASR